MEIDDLIAHLDEMVASGAELERLLETAVLGLSRSDPRFDWTGVYELFSDNMLRLGPFVGAPTDHVFIGVGNGVCGTAVKEARTILVENVHEFPGHIACDAGSESELVVPLFKNGEIIGVLDLDSPRLSRFDAEDQAGMETLAEIFVAASE